MYIELKLKNKVMNKWEGVVFCGRSLKLNFKDIEIDMPTIIPNQTEINYHKRSRTKINPPLIQYVRNFNKGFKPNKILDHIKKLQLEFPHTIFDLFIQIPMNFQKTENQYKMLLKLQSNIRSHILSYTEIDKNQSADNFQKEIEVLKEKYPNKIISPTLDINILKEGLFEEKIDRLLESDIQRVNIIYRSIPQNISNWSVLARKLYNKNIWVNVVGITQRYTGKRKEYQIPKVFLFGANSAASSHPWRGGQNAKSMELDETTLLFSENPEKTYEQTRSETLIKSGNIMKDMRNNINEGSLFTLFVSNKPALNRLVSGSE